MTWPVAVTICVVAVCLTLCFLMFLAARQNKYKAAADAAELARNIGDHPAGKQQSGFAFGDGRN